MPYRRFLWTIVIILLTILTIGDSVGSELELHSGSVVKFASLQEGKELLGRKDPFVAALSRFDKQSRLQTTKEVSEEEFLEFAASHVSQWTADEVAAVTDVLQGIRAKLAEFELSLPREILVIKTTGKEEGNAAYCRQNAIIIPQRLTAGKPASLERLLIHELFHVMSRHSTRLQETLYEIIGFRACPLIELPESLRHRKLTNPDGPSLEWYITLQTNDQQTVRAVPLLYASVDQYDPKSGTSFFGYLQFRLLVVEETVDGWHVSLENNEPQLLDPKEQPSFHRQIGRNTRYIIHPDEILADNFVAMVQKKSGLQTPELITRMSNVLTAKESR